MSERYRYVGPDASRILALSGGGIEFPRMKWVDPEKAAEEAGIPLHHVAIAVAGVGPDFEREGPVKATRTRKKKAPKSTHDEPVVALSREALQPWSDAMGGSTQKPETPAQPDEEQS